MGGRKLDGEAKHNAKQAVSSAPERVHGICINGFDYPPPISLILPTHTQNVCSFLCFYYLVFFHVSVSLPPFFLSAPFILLPDLHHTLHLFFCNFSFAFLFCRLCVSGLMTELVHVELASEWRHHSCLIDAIWWKQASCWTQSDGDKTLESLRIKSKPQFKCDFAFCPRLKLSITHGFWGH